MSALHAAYDASTHYTRNYDLLVGYTVGGVVSRETAESQDISDISEDDSDSIDSSFESDFSCEVNRTNRYYTSTKRPNRQQSARGPRPEMNTTSRIPDILSHRSNIDNEPYVGSMELLMRTRLLTSDPIVPHIKVLWPADIDGPHLPTSGNSFSPIHFSPKSQYGVSGTPKASALQTSAKLALNQRIKKTAPRSTSTVNSGCFGRSNASYEGVDSVQALIDSQCLSRYPRFATQTVSTLVNSATHSK